MAQITRFLVVCALALVTLLATEAAVNGILRSSKADSEVTFGQDVINLDRRVGTLEQRLYSIESTMRQMQMQLSTTSPAATAPNRRDPDAERMRLDVERMRLDIEMLQRRLGEAECALLKLDERTLSPSSREARRAAQPTADPCRLHPEVPIQLSSRKP